MSDPYFNNIVLQTDFEGTTIDYPDEVVCHLSGDKLAIYDSGINQTAALYHFDAANGSTNILEEMSQTVTAAASGAIQTGASKFGGSSFAGAVDTFGAIGATYIIGVEAWVQYPTSGYVTYLYSYGNSTTASSSQGQVAFKIISDEIYVSQPSNNTSGVNEYATTGARMSSKGSTWRHVYINFIFGGPNSFCFIDGVKYPINRVISVVGGYTWYTPTAGACFIGKYLTNFSSQNSVDEVRLYTATPTKYTGGTYTFTVPTAAFVDGAQAGTILHIHGDGGSVVDVGGKTLVSGVASNTAQKRFGDASIFFADTTANYITATHSDFTFGTGDFTVEAWLYTTAHPVTNNDVIFAIGTNTVFIQLTSYPATSQLTIQTNSGGNGQNSTVSQTGLTLNAWNHVVLQRKSNEIQCFLNGALATGLKHTVGVNITSNTVRIGANMNDTYYFAGFMDEIRVVNSALYSIPQYFTPPTEAYTDVYYRYSDYGGVETRRYPTAPYSLSTTEKVFNAQTSLYFDSRSVMSYMAITNGSKLGFGFDDFTLSFWFKGFLFTAVNTIMDWRPAATQGEYPQLYFNSTAALRFYTNSADRIVSTTLCQSAQWHHICLSRKQGKYTLFVDGLSQGSYTSVNSMGTMTDSNNRPLIGNNGHTPAISASGYFHIQDLVITRGRGITASFTPPSALYSVPANNYTTSPMAAFPELKNKIMKPSYSPTIMTSDSKTGSKSVWFPGYGGFSIAHHEDFNPGTGDYTFEMWVKVLSYPVSQYVIASHILSTLGWQLVVNTSGGLYVIPYSSGTVYGQLGTSVNTPVPLNRWAHICFVKKGEYWVSYVNGSVATSAYFSNSVDVTAPLYIGGAGPGAVTVNMLVDGIRITKGVARYDIGTAVSGDPLYNISSIVLDEENTPITDAHNASVELSMTLDTSSAIKGNTITPTDAGMTYTDAGAPFGSPFAARFGGTTSNSISVPYADVNTGAVRSLLKNSVDWCLEFRFKTNGVNTSNYFVGQWDTSNVYANSSWYVGLYRGAANTGYIEFQQITSSATSLGYNSGAIPDSEIFNKWVSVAITKSGADVSFIVNGVVRSVTSMSNQTFYSPSTILQLKFGYLGTGTLALFNGWIRDFRYTVHTPRYPAAAVRPTNTVVTILDMNGTDNGVLFNDHLVRAATVVGSVTTQTSNKKYGTASAYFDYDINWGQTVLALNMDGADNGTVFTDLKGKTVTAAGTAKTFTAVKKYGTASAQFNGASTTYLTTAASTDFDFGTGEFTIECWINIQADSPLDGDGLRYATLISNMNDGSGGWEFDIKGDGTTTGTGLSLGCKTSGNQGGSTNFTFSKNTWYHIAVSGTAAAFTFFVNGVRLDTASITGSINSGGFATTIGCQPTVASWTRPFNGYIDGLRITKGIARYSSSSTAVVPPPTAMVEPVPTALTSAVHTWSFGGSNVSLECWFYVNEQNSTNPWMTLLSKVPSIVDGRFAILVNNVSISITMGTTLDRIIPFARQVNTWHHIALTKYGTEYRVFVDGAQVDYWIGAGSITALAGSLYVGMTQNANAFPFGGFIDNVRVISGLNVSNVYTTPFTPADYTLLEDGRSYTPEAMPPMKSVLTKNGSGIGDSSNSYSGLGSIEFKGYQGYFKAYYTNTYLQYYNGSDFTIEFRLKVPGAQNAVIISAWAHATGSYQIGQWYLSLNSTGGISFARATTSSASSFLFTTANNVIVADTWHHIALCRSAGTMQLYVDGVSKASVGYALALGVSTTTLFFGSKSVENTTGQLLGFMDSIRVSQTYARYTGNFTPPTAHPMTVEQSFIPAAGFSTGLPTVAGNVYDQDGNPASRLVRVYDRSNGRYITETTSDPATGAYDVGVDSTEVYVIALDDTDAPDLNAVIKDRIYPA